MRFLGRILGIWILAGSCTAESLECHIEAVGRLSDDKLSIVTETVFDRFEGTSFNLELLDGSITNLGDLDDHIWRKETYMPTHEKQQYFMRLISETLPQTFAYLNIVKHDRLPEGELYFYVLVDGGEHSYTGKCISSPNN